MVFRNLIETVHDLSALFKLTYIYVLWCGVFDT